MGQERAVILVLAEHERWPERLHRQLRATGAEVHVVSPAPGRGSRRAAAAPRDEPATARVVPLVTSTRPIVLVLDLDVCGGAALEILEQLRATGRTVPAVVLSTSDRAGLLDRALRAGARIVLHKPVSGARLVRAVLRLLRHARRSAHVAALPPPARSR